MEIFVILTVKFDQNKADKRPMTITPWFCDFYFWMSLKGFWLCRGPNDIFCALNLYISSCRVVHTLPLRMGQHRTYLFWNGHTHTHIHAPYHGWLITCPRSTSPIPLSEWRRASPSSFSAPRPSPRPPPRPPPLHRCLLACARSNVTTKIEKNSF